MPRNISGTYTNGITLVNGDNPVTVTGTIAGIAAIAYQHALYGPGGGSNSWTIDNSGTISATNRNGVDLGYYSHPVTLSVVTNESNGVISGHYGVYIVGPGVVTNVAGGSITGTYAGVRLYTDAGSIVNYGAISGPRGVREDKGGSVTNLSTGVMTGINAGVQISGAAGTVVNFGSIYGSNASVIELAGGSITNQNGGTITSTEIAVSQQTIAGNIVNAGTISGGYAVFDTAGGSVTNLSTGVMTGTDAGVYITGDLGTVVNSGALSGTNGAVLAAGGSVLNQAGASISGTNYGVSFKGGLAGTIINSGSLHGDNFGVIASSGGSFTNQSAGTISADSIAVDASAESTFINDGLITSLYAGVRLFTGSTLTNAGTINADTDAKAVSFLGPPSGSNRLIVDPGAVFTGSIDGNTGVMELASAASAGGLSGFGTSITNFGTVEFDPLASWTIAGNDFSTTTIDGFDSDDTIDLTGFVAVTSTFSANTLVLGDGVGTATLHMQGDFSSGAFQIASDKGTGTDITFESRTQPLTIAASYSSGFTLLDGDSPVTVLSTGTVDVASGAALSGPAGVSSDNTWTIDNAGTISSAGGTPADAAIALGALGNPVTNGVVTNEAGGVIFGQYGVYIHGPGSVTNLAGGSITGIQAGVQFTDAAGTVDNAGTLSGGAAGFPLLMGGSVTNQASASITATDQDAISIQGTVGAVVNYGDLLGVRYGVNERAGGSVTNQASGTISGILIAGYTGIVVNKGAVSANYGVFLSAGGSVTNQAGASITGLANDAIYLTGTVANYGTVNGFARGVYGGYGSSVINHNGASIQGGNYAVYLAGGSVTNQTSARITGGIDGVQMGGPGAISNAGTISGSSNGVVLSGGGSVTNQSDGEITGGNLGVRVSGGGLVVNDGSIAGYSNGILEDAGGSITNQGSGIITSSDHAIQQFSTGTIVNAGFIHGGGVGSVGADAVYQDTNGSLTNQSGGTITGSQNAVTQRNGTGTIVNAGTITGGVGLHTIYQAQGGSVTNIAGGLISGGAVIFGGGGGLGVGTLVNAGTVASYVHFSHQSSSNLVVVDAGGVFTGGIYGGAGVLDLTGKGTAPLAGFGTSITNFSSVEFDPAASWTIAGNDFSTTTIDGFDSNDTIDLTGFVATGISFDDGADILTLTNASSSVALNIQGGPTTNFQFTPTSSDTFITTDAPCYRAGTRIRTPLGETPVETLAIGDLLVTRSGEARPIKWIGHRSYAGRFIADNSDVLPIRFAAGSLADGIPTRDLDVSPKHAMFIDDVLVPAEMLVNGVSIRQLEDVDSVEYFHLELASHDVIFADGAASETFVDCDSRAMFHNATDYASRYPDDPGPAWQFCAPRVVPASAELVTILARLAARAGQIQAFGPPEAMLGHIDFYDRLRVRGWILDSTQPGQRVRLEVRLDGEPVGHIVADTYRPDLAKTGQHGDGRHGYNFSHPIRLSPLTDHVFELVRAADGAHVPGSPVRMFATTGFDAECRAGLTQMLNNVAQAATQASDLDELIAYQVTQVEALLAARSRLDIGSRADVPDLHDRWNGLAPTAAVRQSAPDLRPRALFVDEAFPAVNESGGASAAIEHMRSLMRNGFDLSFVASRDLADHSGRAAELSALGITPLLAPWYGSVEEALRRHAGRLDVVYLHRAGNAASYGRLVRQYCPRALLVYGVADLHHLRLARQGAVEDRPEVVRLGKRLQFEEMIAARQADVVITHSSVEAALLRARLPGVVVAVVPWSVPLRASATGFAEREGAVFIGNFGHEPNVDAVHWLAHEIVPLVRRQDPSIVFRVVGNGMSDALRRLARPGLEMVGHIEQIETVLDAARLTVAPLRYGAGLKAKVIESLAACVPCVGTQIAFEGMALPAVLGGCVADTAEAFAAAIIRLHCDEANHATVASAGRRHALVSYGETSVDALMRQAVAPALRRWAGIAEAEHGGTAAMRLAG
jgi:glycosyltransferase involved in cell wall biosynthesis